MRRLNLDDGDTDHTDLFELHHALLSPDTVSAAILALADLTLTSPARAASVVDNSVLNNVIAYIPNDQAFNIIASTFNFGNDDIRSSIISLLPPEALLKLLDKEPLPVGCFCGCCRLMALFAENGAVDAPMAIYVCEIAMKYLPETFECGKRAYERAFPHVVVLLQRLVANDELTDSQFATAAKFVGFLLTSGDSTAQISGCKFWDISLRHGYDASLLDQRRICEIIAHWDGEVREAACKLVFVLIREWGCPHEELLSAMIKARGDDFGSMRARADAVLEAFDRRDIGPSVDAVAAVVDFLRIDDPGIVRRSLLVLSECVPALMSDPEACDLIRGLWEHEHGWDTLEGVAITWPELGELAEVFSMMM